ncbi:MAG: ATP-binding protein [Vicinamibacterales bacterium]
MASSVSLTLGNRLDELLRLDACVRSFGAEHELPDDLVFQLNVALDEIVTNVISYAYDDVADHDVVVRLSVDDQWVSAQVEDDGRAFNPLQVPRPDLAAGLDRPGVGGLGVYFVQSMMDSVEYCRRDGRNILIIARRRRQALEPQTP